VLVLKGCGPKGYPGKKDEDGEKDPSVNWFYYHFLGLIHGHFDVPTPMEDVVVEDGNSQAGVNTGMGIVIPAKMIRETLYQPDLREERKRLYSKTRRRRGATPDLAI
jgi:hypothetical protein